MSLQNFLNDLQQPHLHHGCEHLSAEEQEAFYRQLCHFEREALAELRTAWKQKIAASLSLEQLSPLSNVSAPQKEHEEKGRNFLRQGKAGCLILAGGQGTRLGVPLSKGFVPVTPVQKKTLFQLIFEKASHAAKISGSRLPIAILASPLNSQSIRKYLEQNQYFGFPYEDVEILEQRMVPFMDDEGNWALSSPGQLALGPNGNGEALKIFYSQGIWEKWRSRGVEALHVLPIDNPLADPFFFSLMGLYASTFPDVAILATQRRSINEPIGILASREGKTTVVEYTEIPPEKIELERFAYANTGIFVFSMAFIERSAKFPSPWHFSRKKAEILTPSEGSAPAMLWKAEKFLFDVLAHAERSAVLTVAREQCFAPLKNAQGEDSFDAVCAALLGRDKRILAQLSGMAIDPHISLELDPAFYYPDEQLQAQWAGRTLPPGVTYVLP